ncbi:CBN-SCL-22 protein [Caenorhabditis brenneri]|uniref:CBN-SCL-22 protein n=1 Tax=Caenorhabditis brenneri TaxID=135651 RepID=G0MHP0_CAEBE|nr:CBN-SCL-22 protein [Caenorhabditis brenneri]
MIKMEYDCMLERFAQNWANKCVFAHSSHYERPNQGQNLYMSSFTNPDPRSLIHTAVEKWWQELEEFGTPIDNVLTPELWDLKGKAIGHYTQMAWDRTYRLGCGIANCPKMSYVVCHYGPAGNRKNNKIYEIGDPCEIDDDCPIGTDCEKTTSLCVISK